MDIIRSFVGLVTRNGHLISAWFPDEMPTSVTNEPRRASC